MAPRERAKAKVTIPSRSQVTGAQPAAEAQEEDVQKRQQGDRGHQHRAVDVQQEGAWTTKGLVRYSASPRRRRPAPPRRRCPAPSRHSTTRAVRKTRSAARALQATPTRRATVSLSPHRRKALPSRKTYSGGCQRAQLGAARSRPGSPSACAPRWRGGSRTGPRRARRRRTRLVVDVRLRQLRADHVPGHGRPRHQDRQRRPQAARTATASSARRCPSPAGPAAASAPGSLAGPSGVPVSGERGSPPARRGARRVRGRGAGAGGAASGAATTAATAVLQRGREAQAPGAGACVAAVPGAGAPSAPDQGQSRPSRVIRSPPEGRAGHRNGAGSRARSARGRRDGTSFSRLAPARSRRIPTNGPPGR